LRFVTFRVDRRGSGIEDFPTPVARKLGTGPAASNDAAYFNIPEWEVSDRFSAFSDYYSRPGKLIAF
jgi:hypothetical protein